MLLCDRVLAELCRVGRKSVNRSEAKDKKSNRDQKEVVGQDGVDAQ